MKLKKGTQLTALRTAAAGLTCLAGLCMALPLSAGAMDWGSGIQAKFEGLATWGTTLRTEDPSASVLGGVSAARVPGAPAGQLAAGSSAGGNDLNFSSGQAVSTVLKAMGSMDLRQQDTGVFLRAKGWQDTALKTSDHAYGNWPNGFTPNARLSDAGFAPEAQFANLQWMDVYGYTQLDVGATSALALRLGRQYVNWGQSKFLAGGVNAINPFNYAAGVRPGAAAEEMRLPVGMLYGLLQTSDASTWDGFVQYESRANVLPGCGTFYSTANFASTGCGFVNALPGVSDPTALATGRYAHRADDVAFAGSGQFGLSWKFEPRDMAGHVRLYAMQYHSRAPSIRLNSPTFASGLDTTQAALIQRLTGPGATSYAMQYPEAIQLLGASFESKLDPTRQFYGEVAYRPNQPLNLNAADLMAAFLSRAPNSALNLAKGVNAIGLGGSFDGYDRFKVTTASVGAVQVLPQVLAAERWLLTAELGLSHVASLPSASTLRYGRSDDFGVAAYTGGPVCIDTSVAQKTCAQDGFVTSLSWGYRMQLSAAYSESAWGAAWTPMLYVAHDVSGYSFDGTFVEGRRVMRPGVRVLWREGYFGEMHYHHTWGGRYNTQIDRSTLSVIGGVRF
ncbi:DUF1302 domain-containing protein [Limnohabitans sp.]|uniref:DUF1302 domain-containing protein n=1 Tax=Limnohabitans sp. TaxID=1907725 RepID=UPI0038BB3E51